MPLNMSFGLISARKPCSSTVLLNSFVLFQKELSTVVWRLKPWRPVHGTAGLHPWLTTAWAPLSPFPPLWVQQRKPGSSRVTWPMVFMGVGITCAPAHLCASNVLTSSLITQSIMAAVGPGTMLAQPAVSNTRDALLQHLKCREIRLFCLINEEINPDFDVTIII